MVYELTRLESFRAGNTLITSETVGVSFVIHARLPVKVDFMSFLILGVDEFDLLCSAVRSANFVS